MSESQKSEIVPFGKYRGQPLEAIAGDKQYTDWLVAQPWFRERYGNLYAIVINNFCDPSETPEHNALQARFLDDDFRLQFASIAIPSLWKYSRFDSPVIRQVGMFIAKKMVAGEGEDLVKGICSEGIMAATGQPAFEERGIDCMFEVKAGILRVSAERFNALGGKSEIAHWESGGIDHTCLGTLKIEIKPDIGDDYPAILRQMRRNGSQFLFTREYIGRGVDLPTFIRFMDSQKIRVIFESDITSSEKFLVETFDADRFMNMVSSICEQLKK